MNPVKRRLVIAGHHLAFDRCRGVRQRRQLVERHAPATAAKQPRPQQQPTSRRPQLRRSNHGSSADGHGGELRLSTSRR